METDKHYFFEGLFIIGFSVAAAIFAVWLGSAGRHDDVLYRIHFPESVSGLTVGDTVKYRGIDVGTVKSMIIDPDNSRLVLVDVRLRKETPVKTDTRATLALKGITGVVFIELNGGDPAAKTLLAVTPPDKIPEIPSEKTGLKAMLDELPKLVEKFGALEDQIKKVVTNVGALTDKVKANPSLLLRRPEKENNDARRK
ncbi:MlaD family protein [Sulfuricella sp.]|uniref:MlaD family protein n=1 Tax=Sulfuricella sp. TaxID=2099377 RepID=UPI002CED0166|nr:MlaD family protein [Sulfuricella sp.]HUX65182.1 MlaD family protein [Sulfuricella sp.]